MTVSRTRNILTFVVPAIIAFLSAYWFRKKRKLKQVTDERRASETSAEVSCTFEQAKDQNLTVANDVSCMKSEDETNTENSENCIQSEKKYPALIDCNSTANGHVDVPVKNILDTILTRPDVETKDSEDDLSPADFQVSSGFSSVSANGDNLSALCSEKVSLDCSKTENSESSVHEDTVSSTNSNPPIDHTSLKDSEYDHCSETPMLESFSCVQEVCNNGQSEVASSHHHAIDDNHSLHQINRAADLEFSSTNTTCDASVKCTDSLTDPIEASQQSEGEITSNNIVQKSSPTSTGSPVSHSNDASSDCEALSSVGTSSISLSELFSTSPVDSVKEQLNFQVDAFVNEDVCNDSGKGSTILDPASSCSLSSELNEVSPEEPQISTFHYSRRSNADVLCRQVLDSTDHTEPMNEQYSFYNDSDCNPSHHLKKSIDALSEVSGVSSNGSNVNYVQIMDSKTDATASSHYVYEFELPQELCGRLIGRQGKNVKFIKDHSNATVYIKRHPYSSHLKLAVVEGNRHDVNHALELLRKKFPLSQFPSVSLAQTNAAVSALGVPVPESLQRRSLYFYYLLPPPYIFNSWVLNFTDMFSANSFSQLQLPENTSVDVILSSMVSAGHFFLQQPTHPTYPSLSTLDQCMMACYSQGETPCLPQPIEAGVVCAASIMSGWYRAQVVFVFENSDDCEVKFVDYGGYSRVSASSLRQIRSDFMTLPFQASECYLAKVQPLNAELGWSAEASLTFEELAQGQILQAVIVGYHEDGVPYVYLYRVQGITSTFINRELVSRGFAKWIDHQ